MIIYLVTNIVNGKMYVGQTVNNLKKRKRRHIADAKLYKDNIYFHNALRKYGPDFKWEIIHECDNIDLLNRLEIFYIGYHDTFGNGYNLNAGGKNTLASKKTRKKMSLAQTGKKLSTETRKKMSLAATGKKASAETKKKLSLAVSGKNNPFYNKKHSQEFIEKMSGKKNPNAVAVIIDDKYFYTREEAAKFIGISSSQVRYRILHKTKWLDYHYTVR